jgi:two-component system, OmpR family, alkaline phosphatase synthesis response regulator PhoP
MAPRLLLVDDEPDLLDLLRYTLQQAGFDVETARDGAEALTLARTSPPELIVLDVMMPGMSGLEVCQAIRSDPGMREIPILMLTARSAEPDEMQGLEAGADDYVAKPVSPRLLVSRIRALMRRTHGFQDESLDILRVFDLEIDRSRYLVLRNAGSGAEERMHFPRKEFELIRVLASAPGKVFSREELLDEVWGTDVYVTTRTVDVHIRKIRKKLGSGYVETVTGVGYRLSQPPDGG